MLKILRILDCHIPHHTTFFPIPLQNIYTHIVISSSSDAFHTFLNMPRNNKKNISFKLIYCIFKTDRQLNNNNSY